MATPDPKIKRSRRKGCGCLIILCTGLLLITALFLGRRRYVEHHAALIRAGLAAAEAEGQRIFDQMGTVPDSHPIGAVQKQYTLRKRRGMWRGTTTGIHWKQEYEIPGEYEQIAGWYDARLRSAGWSLFGEGPTSSVQRIYHRDKWFVTIWREADFQNPPRTRVMIDLNWSYWNLAD